MRTGKRGKKCVRKRMIATEKRKKKGSSKNNIKDISRKSEKGARRAKGQKKQGERKIIRHFSE